MAPALPARRAQTAAISTLLRQLGALLEAWVNVGVFEAIGAALDAELGDREARDAQLLELECTALQFLMHPRGEVRADAVQARCVWWSCEIIEEPRNHSGNMLNRDSFFNHSQHHSSLRVENQ